MAGSRYKNGNARRKLRARIIALGEPCWICRLSINANIPARHPEALEVDEVIPYSKGGSPTDLANTRAAHRCCNNWRKDKPEWWVLAIAARVRAEMPYTTPEQFVANAKAIARKPAPKRPQPPIETTTEW